MVNRLPLLTVTIAHFLLAVRLGSSGLKVSKFILGCMSYGSPEWQSWVLPEEESMKHIKAAYVYCPTSSS